MITHDTRPIECGICNARFPSEDNLRNHQKRSHENCMTKEATCDDCNSGFTTNNDLKHHIKLQHEAVELKITGLNQIS